MSNIQILPSQLLIYQKEITINVLTSQPYSNLFWYNKYLEGQECKEATSLNDKVAFDDTPFWVGKIKVISKLNPNTLIKNQSNQNYPKQNKPSHIKIRNYFYLKKKTCCCDGVHWRWRFVLHQF